MQAPLDCPEMGSWNAWFGDELPPEQQELYDRHLESCCFCQERLDRIDDPTLLRARRLGDPTARPLDPTLIHVLEAMRGFKPRTAAEPADLYFLHPGSRPDVLGTLDDYEVQEVIGEGGMGVVLKAFDPSLHRTVAIKVLAASVAGSATARLRFTREARAAAAVSHDHVIVVHGVHETDGLPYLVMEYIAGESLQERIDRNGQLELTEIVRIAMQTASGLAAAHAQGLIHRDIKPANLLLENGVARVTITDFGLARSVDDVGVTQNGVLAGTPEYMAPEQARGEPVDHRSDLFSLGSVLYAMCTGRPPFQGSTAMSVLRQVIDEAPPPVRTLNAAVPAWLDALIERLMAKNSSDRPSSAAEVAELLEGYLGHLRQPAVIAPPPLPGPAPGTSRRPHLSSRFRLLLCLTLCALAAVVLAPCLWLLIPQAGVEPPAKQDAVQERYFQFKENPVSHAQFALYGDADPYVRYEPAGLRIAMPTGRPQQRHDTGVSTKFGIHGDFEITCGYEILAESLPAEAGGPGARLTLTIAVEDQAPGLIMAAISRMVSQKEGIHYGAWQTVARPPSGKADERYKSIPTKVKAGRLRLARTGTQLRYDVADSADGEFKRLTAFPFTAEDVRFIAIAAYTGGPKVSLDARVIDLRVRAQSLPGIVDEPAEPAELPAPTATPTGNYTSLLTASGLLVSFALGVGVLVWRYRRRRAPTTAGAAGRPGQAVNAAVPIAFACSDCGKPLKARAELAGKKVKCPQCGKPILVSQAK